MHSNVRSHLARRLGAVFLTAVVLSAAAAVSTASADDGARDSSGSTATTTPPRAVASPTTAPPTRVAPPTTMPPRTAPTSTVASREVPTTVAPSTMVPPMVASPVITTSSTTLPAPTQIVSTVTTPATTIAPPSRPPTASTPNVAKPAPPTESATDEESSPDDVLFCIDVDIDGETIKVCWPKPDPVAEASPGAGQVRLNWWQRSVFPPSKIARALAAATTSLGVEAPHIPQPDVVGTTCQYGVDCVLFYNWCALSGGEWAMVGNEGGSIQVECYFAEGAPVDPEQGALPFEAHSGQADGGGDDGSVIWEVVE
jgi:hypothetical protein